MGKRIVTYVDVEWEDVELSGISLTDRSDKAKNMAAGIECTFGRLDFAHASLRWKETGENIGTVDMEPRLDEVCGFHNWYANIYWCTSVQGDVSGWFKDTLKREMIERIDMSKVRDMFEWAIWDPVWTLYNRRDKSDEEVAEAILDIFEREGIETKEDVMKAKSGYDPYGDFLQCFDVDKDGEVPPGYQRFVDIYEKAGLDVEVRQRHTDPEAGGHFGIYLKSIE